MRWYAQDEVNQKVNEQNEVEGTKKDRWFHRWGDVYLNLKERLVICNEEETDGRARVTTDEERVLHVDPGTFIPIPMASTCTSMLTVRRSALRPGTLRQPSHVSLRVSSTSRLGWRPVDSIRYDTIEEINVDSKAEYTA